MFKMNKQKISEKIINPNGFINLPDHEKMELKKLGPPFNNYPLMSNFETYNRNEWINNVCCHFSNMDEETFMLHDSYVALNYWPDSLNTLLTPRSLDYIDVDSILSFGFCYYCNHFTGSRINNHKTALFTKGIKNKVIPIYGKCNKADNMLRANNKNFRNVSIVNLDFRCANWDLAPFFKMLLKTQIKDEIQNSRVQKKRPYMIHEYEQDTSQVDFWDFFIMN